MCDGRVRVFPATVRLFRIHRVQRRGAPNPPADDFYSVGVPCLVERSGHCDLLRRPRTGDSLHLPPHHGAGRGETFPHWSTKKKKPVMRPRADRRERQKKNECSLALLEGKKTRVSRAGVSARTGWPITSGQAFTRVNAGPRTRRKATRAVAGEIPSSCYMIPWLPASGEKSKSEDK